MRLSQYVYFAIRSESITAVEVTAALGMQPDEVQVRGSKNPKMDVPRNHSWAIACRQADVPIDGQVQQVLRRLEPIADEVASLVAVHQVSATLQIVRYFNDEAQEESEGRLLGWGLSPKDLALLARIGANIDADEYGG